MATRVNVMKMLQTARGAAEVVKTQPQLKPVLSPLQSPPSYIKRLVSPKRRLVIQVNMRSLSDIPTPVIITHLAAPIPTPLPVPLR